MSRWRYEVDVGVIEGYVEAPDEETAMSAAADDASFNADDALEAGTWTVHEVTDD